MIAPAAPHEERGVAPFHQRAQVQRRRLRRRAVRRAAASGPATGRAPPAGGRLGGRKDHPERRHARAIQQAAQSGKPVARTAKGGEIIRCDLVVGRIAEPEVMGLLGRPKAAELAGLAHALEELSTRTLIAGSVDPACGLGREGRQPAEESRHDASSIERDGKPARARPVRSETGGPRRRVEERRARDRVSGPAPGHVRIGGTATDPEAPPIGRRVPNGHTSPDPRRTAARGVRGSRWFCCRLRPGMATMALNLNSPCSGGVGLHTDAAT